MRHKKFSSTAMAFYLFAFCALTFGIVGCEQSWHIPDALETVLAKDGSLWERVSESGFGDDENAAVVAMQEYKGRLYAIVRNDKEGVEVWRPTGTGWEQVLFPSGVTNGIYGNPWINTHMGAMIVFKKKLYLGFSSGIQGSYLRSSGCEVWRYDGITWEQVTDDGFGDVKVLNFEALAEFNDTLYLSASRASNTVGGGLGGAEIFRLAN